MNPPDPLNSVFGYYGRFQSARGRVTGLPSWARGILYLLASPGILLLALSIVLLVVSILALLLLTAPAYWALRSLTRNAAPVEEGAIVVESTGAAGEPARKRVEATVVDPPE